MNVAATEPRIASLYDIEGPFVTAYLDATRSTESGAHEVGLRWREARGQLVDQGADEPVLDAMEQWIDADAGTPGPHGLVLVAAAGEVQFADRLPAPPATSTAIVSALPHLLPYLAQRASEVPHVVVLADRSGAEIFAVSADGDHVQQTVEGRAEYPVHRTATADWSERHFQLRVENTWQSNARDVAGELIRVVKENAARLVIIAGDVRARSLIADAVGSQLGPDVAIRVIEEGGRAAGSSREALEGAVHDHVLRQAWRERRSVLEHLAQNLGRGAYAVAGLDAVVNALRMAQADTVVLSDDPSSTLRAWVGPAATDFGLDDGEADDLGVQPIGHDRFDAALVRAVLGTGARLVVTPGAHDYLPDGIGALLRYET